MIVVSGLPRSGTSALMQMLERGGLPVLTDRARPADESNPRGYYEYAPVKRLRQESSWLDEAEGQALKVVAPLLPHLPDGPRYRVLLMRRDLQEVLASQARMLERLGRPVGKPELLRKAFERHLARAEQWVEQQVEAAMLDVEHARLIEAPQAVAASVAAFLGRPLDVEAMAGAVDPTLHRERAG